MAGSSVRVDDQLANPVAAIITVEVSKEDLTGSTDSQYATRVTQLKNLVQSELDTIRTRERGAR